MTSTNYFSLSGLHQSKLSKLSAVLLMQTAYVARGQVYFDQESKDSEQETKDSDKQRYFMCVFGPDSSGAYHEEIVPEAHAKNCDTFCVCQDVKTTCLLGPDSLCNYATEEVDRDFADNCERDSCTCTSHTNYFAIANERLNSSAGCLEQIIANNQVTQAEIINESGQVQPKEQEQENEADESGDVVDSIFNIGEKDSDKNIFNHGADDIV